MAKRGPPKVEIDKKYFENLCAIQCTMEEILAVFDISDKTLSAWCRRTYGKKFSEVFQIKRQAGFMSLRRKQLALAENSAAMAIWLGKNWLGQFDKDKWQRQHDTEILLLQKENLALQKELLELKKHIAEQKEW